MLTLEEQKAECVVWNRLDCLRPGQSATVNDAHFAKVARARWPDCIARLQRISEILEQSSVSTGGMYSIGQVAEMKRLAGGT